MNFLFHMLLSGEDDQILAGNFMGDFVKGPLAGRFPERIRRGIALHRGIDSYASRDDLFQRSRRRLDPGYGLYRGVLVDLFYDHFLVIEWHNWSDEPLDRYLARTRSVIERQQGELPERLQRIVPVIFEELLPSYGEVSGIGRALERMSRRVVRENPLAGGERELVRNYDELRDDFCGFMPGVRLFAQEFLRVS
ncbi:MAG TPA: ACP phosphodiesterase [Dongiaceae bacterium]|nr:ACP phosphodiesterase [Dongiaceae bacterium]